MLLKKDFRSQSEEESFKNGFLSRILIQVSRILLLPIVEGSPLIDRLFQQHRPISEVVHICNDPFLCGPFTPFGPGASLPLSSRTTWRRLPSNSRPGSLG